jgi:hypothetical protein
VRGSTMTASHLEDDQELVELLLGRALVEAHAARVEQGADEPHAEEVVGRIDGARPAGHGKRFGCETKAGEAGQVS